ncbi:MAG TPA: hypothetical protein DEA90_00805 [Opitutae bacterium]|nr:hypothetical protein [Puniceicoccaceae bacterium]HBR92687.1 hypothetical protein [Opitutae bacterium]|tara:strand:+ start:12629 stop:13519 length:891 start_codon:yes stop_codon:yes gene_type:complete
MFNKYSYTLFALTLITATASADTTWIGAGTDAASSDIGDAANWSDGLPTNSDPASEGFIGLVGGSPVTVELESRSDLNGRNYTVSNGSTIHSVGDFPDTSNDGFRWGNSTLTLDGGHLDIDSAETSYLGRGGAVTIHMNAGSSLELGGTAYLGYDSTVVVNQNGGTTVVGGTMVLQWPYNADPSGNIFNLSAGTVTVGGLTVNDENGDSSNYFNFTSGSTGSLTITEAGFDFESMVNAGEIRINGNATSVFADFAVDSSIGGQTTLSLIPEPGAYALLTGVCALSAIMLRRRERRA